MQIRRFPSSCGNEHRRPLTIASNLRGVERLLRDLRKCPDDALRLIRLVADSERSCIDLAAQYGMGIANADPVANPALIGPKMYERFVYPIYEGTDGLRV